MDARKATPEETAAMLLRNYDDALASQTGDTTQTSPAVAATLRAAARLADFVATQYSCDTPVK